MMIRVSCTLLKLAQGSSIQICKYAIGTSTVPSIIHNTYRAINVVLRHENIWRTGTRLVQTQHRFKWLCGLPTGVGQLMELTLPSLTNGGPRRLILLQNTWVLY